MELEKFILFFFFGFVFGLITDEIIDRRNTESRIRVYIAGPIASDPDYEDNFTNAHIELLMQGYIVENPVEEGKKLTHIWDWSLHWCLSEFRLSSVPCSRYSKNLMDSMKKQHLCLEPTGFRPSAECFFRR